MFFTFSVITRYFYCALLRQTTLVIYNETIPNSLFLSSPFVFSQLRPELMVEEDDNAAIVISGRVHTDNIAIAQGRRLSDI